MKLYDKNNQQLVYINEKATPQFWDQFWSSKLENLDIIINFKGKIICKLTKQFIPDVKSGQILEGGCGSGKFISALHKQKYNVVGIDYAEKTIATIHKNLPHLNAREGDIRNLPFKDNQFIGYWSLGVIEHYLEGYDKIAAEMYRVIKHNGYLFLAFPYMNPLRRLKSAFKLYPDLKEDTNEENFYQFALNAKTVTNNFTQRGFTLQKKVSFDIKSGLNDDLPQLKNHWLRLNKINKYNVLLRFYRKMLHYLVFNYAKHGIILVFKKERP